MDITHTTPANHKTTRAASSNLKRSHVAQGTHTLKTHAITNAKWSRQELKAGEQIDASVETVGLADGTEISFSFYEKQMNSPDICRDVQSQKVSGNKAKVTWKYPEKVVPKNNPTAYSDSLLYFVAKSASLRRPSDTIPFLSELNIKVEKEDGSAIPNVKAVIKLSNGVNVEQTTDSSGKIAIKKVPARVHRIVFPNSPRAVPADETIGDFDLEPKVRNILAFGSDVHMFRMIEMYAYCSHENEGKRRSVANTSVFEVVPDYKGSDSYKDKVVILSRTATSLQQNSSDLEKKEKEFGMNAFLLECQQDFGEDVPNIFSTQFWKGLFNPNEYKITGLPYKSFTVKCYRPDRYKLQLQFPELGKWKGGSRLQTSTTNIKNSAIVKKPIEFKHQPAPKGDGWSLTKYPKKFQSDTTILFLRNGTQIDVKFMDFLGAFVDLSNKLSQIISFVEDNVPQVGFYFKWECQVLQGTFVIEWGWKEYEDYRAYYYTGVNLDVKLIEVKLEIGVGISGFTFKIQLYGALNGSISLSVRQSVVSPEGNPEFDFPFGGEIIGSLGARAEVGCWVKMEGTVETGIQAEDGAFKFSKAEGWSAKCTLKWSGLVGRLKVSGGTAKKEGTDELKSDAQVIAEQSHEITPNETDEKGHSEYEHELIKSQELGKWEWSKNGAKEYSPPVIPREDLHKMLKKRLTEGKGVQVRVGEGWLGLGYKHMDDDEMAREIEDKIHERNDIRKDQKSAEGLAFEIRQSLDNIYYGKFRGTKDYIENEEFASFLKGDELKRILDDDIDPIQNIIDKHESRHRSRS
jgi:hypothetical protein